MVDHLYYPIWRKYKKFGLKHVQLMFLPVVFKLLLNIMYINLPSLLYVVEYFQIPRTIVSIFRAWGIQNITSEH